MRTKSFTLIAGLPGSGKTTLGNKLKQGSPDTLFIDDPTDLSFLDDIHDIHDIIIADPNFCLEKNQVSAENKLIEKFLGCVIRWVFLDVPQEICRGRCVHDADSFITSLSLNMKIPAHAIIHRGIE